MSKVILFIHGRANKPPKDVLLQCWRDALCEGLRVNEGEEFPDLACDLCFYADMYYGELLTEATNEEPYRQAAPGAIRSYRAGLLDRARDDLGASLNDPAGAVERLSGFFSGGSKQVLKAVMKDLGEYYNNAGHRETLHGRLTDLLKRYAGDEIILIAHSMGTIVSYNVLRELGKDPALRHITVEHFITVGSPLGLTSVQGHIVREHGRLRTPSCVTGSWANFADKRDPVALDSHLYDDYEANSRNYVRVRDYTVWNDYPGNAHKAYGYLRTPELSAHVVSLL